MENEISKLAEDKKNKKVWNGTCKTSEIPWKNQTWA
jgi:hypothetical protein